MQRRRLAVPVSQHPIDSVNLKDPKLGIYEQIVALVKQHGVMSGRVRLELANPDGRLPAGLRCKAELGLDLPAAGGASAEARRAPIISAEPSVVRTAR